LRVLLIEDEKALSDAVVKVLRTENIICDAEYDGESGLDEALTGIYDAIILDVMLPKMDGFTVLEKLRREGVITPVMMLTARGALEDRLRGLGSGADYYLPKPFRMEEMLACLKVITRRKSEAPVMTLGMAGTVLRAGSLVNTENGQSIRLGGKEYQLMELFLRNQKQLLTKEQIFERVWGYDSDAELNVIEVYMSFLRKKLQFVHAPLRLRAARGLGYILEEDT